MPAVRQWRQPQMSGTPIASVTRKHTSESVRGKPVTPLSLLHSLSYPWARHPVILIEFLSGRKQEPAVVPGSVQVGVCTTCGQREREAEWCSRQTNVASFQNVSPSTLYPVIFSNLAATVTRGDLRRVQQWNELWLPYRRGWQETKSKECKSQGIRAFACCGP